MHIWRVEKLSELISEKLVAVYRGERFVSDAEPLYGMTVGYEGHLIDDFSFIQVQDEKLDELVTAKLALDKTDLVIKHYRISPMNSVYSMINNNTVSYITEMTRDSLTVLLKNQDDTMIREIFPLPLTVNSKPVIIISGGVRESDYMWDYPAIFADSVYTNAPAARIKIK